nr:hypothetical protein [uncultured Ruminococcus sp.]
MAKWEGFRCKLYMNFQKQKRQHTKPVISPDRMLLRENDFKAIPHKERLATLHAICVQIFRHISQKCS